MPRSGTELPNTTGLLHGADQTFTIHVTLASTVDRGVVLHNTASVATTTRYPRLTASAGSSASKSRKLQAPNSSCSSSTSRKTR